ncbi:MAG: restriction endonuclease subunit S [Alphaproteobacteria bacterium]|nr:restriction endonuclease subunit S [Alphaproteobacteria bacterium]
MRNWEKGCLSDLIKSLEQGVSVNSIDDNNINETTPLILKTSCVSARFFDPTESKKIHPKDLGKQKLNPVADSILISRMNTPALVGASAYVKKTYKNIFLPDRLWMAVKKHDEVCMEWLSQIIASDYYWSKIRDCATGTSPSMKNISKKDLLKLPILIPSYAEQLKISKVLKTWDTAIEKTEALLAAKERQFGWLKSKLLSKNPNRGFLRNPPKVPDLRFSLSF